MKYAQGQRLTHAVVHSINNILFIVVMYMARTNDSKIDHVELLKAYNISLSYCTVHIVWWNINEDIMEPMGRLSCVLRLWM